MMNWTDNKTVQALQAEAEALLAREKELTAGIAAGPGNAAAHLELVDCLLDLMSRYIVLADLFQHIQGRTNEDLLNVARKTLNRSLLRLEELVTNWIDASWPELEERLAALDGIGAEQRYRMVRKVGLSISLLQNAWGDTSKWKWSLVDFEGRHAAVAKNLLDLKNLVANMDPRSPSYEPVVLHLRMLKNLLARAAKRYREKYELSTHLAEDFQKGVGFLQALRKLHLFIGEREEAEELKKTIDAWSGKLGQDARIRKHSPK